MESSSTHPARRYKFRQAILSDVGLKREENQDSYGYAHTSLASLYIVADGMGGARGGATASAIAVDSVLRSVFDASDAVSEESLKSSIEASNEAIFSKSRIDEQLSGMGTTIIVLAFLGDKLLVAHVGDSRAYRLREGRIERLSRDHTLVQELLDSGAITAEEASHHPIAHMLTRSLGPMPAVEVECVTYPDTVLPGDRFIICSDGLYNVVSNEEIGDLLKQDNLDAIAHELLQLVLERGAPDNVTFQIIEAHPLEDASVEMNIPEKGRVRVLTSAAEETEAAAVPPAPEPQSEMKAAESEADAGQLEAADEAADFGAEDFAAEQESAAGPADAAIEEVEPEQITEEELEEQSEDGAAEHEHRPISISAILIGAAFIITAIVMAVVAFSLSGRGRSEVALAPVPEVSRPAATPVPAPSEPARQAPVVRATPVAQPEEIKTPEPAPATATSTPLPVTPEPVARQEAASDAAWPTVAITGDEARRAEDRHEGVSSEAKMRLQRIEQIIARADDLAIPPLPQLDIPPAEGVQAIDWDKEKELLPEAEKPGAEPKFMVEGEKRDLSRRKSELRERIADIDAKLIALDQESTKALDEQRRAAGEEIAGVHEALAAAKESVEGAKENYRRWQTRKSTVSEQEAIRMVDEIAGSDLEVQQKKKDYSQIQQQYQKALEDWQRNPRDQTLVPQISKLGRELKAERSVLEQLVTSAIDRGLKQALYDLSLAVLTKSNVERYLERKSRIAGFFQVAQPNVQNRNAAIQRTLLSDRLAAVRELNKLRARFSDAEEIEFRRSDELRKLNFVTEYPNV